MGVKHRHLAFKSNFCLGLYNFAPPPPNKVAGDLQLEIIESEASLQFQWGFNNKFIVYNHFNMEGKQLKALCGRMNA